MVIKYTLIKNLIWFVLWSCFFLVGSYLESCKKIYYINSTKNEKDQNCQYWHILDFHVRVIIVFWCNSLVHDIIGNATITHKTEINKMSDYQYFQNETMTVGKKSAWLALQLNIIQNWYSWVWHLWDRNINIRSYFCFVHVGG